MQRREFVVATGTMLAAGLPAAATLPVSAPIVLPRGLKILNGATFSGLLNQSFNVYESKRGVMMQLTDVAQVPAPSGHEQFTLTFSAPGTTLKSGTYDVEHPAIGLTAMYLEARTEGKYLAYFNLLA